jgi:hypothetical protein
VRRTSLVVVGCIAYAILSLMSSLLSIEFDISVPFAVQRNRTGDDIVRMVYLIALLCGGMVLGGFFGARMPLVEQLRLRRRFSPHPILMNVGTVLLCVGAAYFTVSALESFTFERQPGEIQRISGLGVLSQFVLIGCGCLAIINLELRRFVILTAVLAAYISIIYGLSQGSRSAVFIPAVLLAFFAFGRNWRGMLLTLLLLVVTLITSSIGRTVVRGFEVGPEFLADVDVIATLFESWQYFVTFSMLHFAYAAEVAGERFGLAELLYSLSPIPSQLWSAPPDPGNWRFDRYRPLGAQAEIWGISPVLNFALALIIGFLGGLSERISSQTLKTIVGSLLLFAFAISFQYGLRSIQWFVWFAAAGTVIAHLLGLIAPRPNTMRPAPSGAGG